METMPILAIYVLLFVEILNSPLQGYQCLKILSLFGIIKQILSFLYIVIVVPKMKSSSIGQSDFDSLIIALKQREVMKNSINKFEIDTNPLFN